MLTGTSTGTRLPRLTRSSYTDAEGFKGLRWWARPASRTLPPAAVLLSTAVAILSVWAGPPRAEAAARCGAVVTPTHLHPRWQVSGTRVRCRIARSIISSYLRRFNFEESRLTVRGYRCRLQDGSPYAVACVRGSSRIRAVGTGSARNTS